MTPEPAPLQVLLVDDHPAVREGLGLLLAQDGIGVCGKAGGCSEARMAVAQVLPDVAVVDLSLGSESGLDVVRDLAERGVPVLVYSMHEDGEHLRQALAAGARGYVTKRALHRVLVDAIHEVAAGRGFLSPRAAAALAEELVRTGKRSNHRDLSEREHEVYRLLGEGATTAEIGLALHVSVRTVESYCARIMEKLGLDGMRPLRRDAIHHVHNGRE